MFKELGEFIDNVGRATGRMIGQILSDKDDDRIDGLMGYINLPTSASREEIERMYEEGLLSEEERDVLLRHSRDIDSKK